MSSRAYVNGELVPKLDAKVSVYDHGLLYGDGVWEGMRLFGGKVFRLDEHLELLASAARAVFLPLPFTVDELAAAVNNAVAPNSRTDGYVRLVVTRGAGTIGLDPRKCDPQLIVLVDDVVPFPADLYGHGLHAITATRVRLDPSNPLHRVRSLSHAHMVVAKAEALRAGCLEAVLHCVSGSVARCTEGHLFALKAGTIRTPAVGIPIEVARGVVLEAAKHLALTVEEAELSCEEVLSADELFLAGTSGGVIAVVRLDGRDIGSGSEGPTTRAIRHAYREITWGSPDP